jgi:hypothetical protein
MKPHLIPLVLATSLAAASSLPAQEVLKAPGTPWEYLQFNDFLGDPIDPARVDEGFRTTWMDPVRLGYDGPEFATATGYFGYGEIDGATIATNLWNPDGSKTTDLPPTGLRHSVYFLTTITPAQPASFLRFTGIIDDGCIIYLDGVELTRINMPDGPDVWDLTASATSDEDVPVTQVAAATLSAGRPVTVAVSLHNSGAGSSDLGFDLMIESIVPIIPANDNFADATALAGPLPIAATGDNGNGLGQLQSLGASKEAGEPDHAGDAGGGSVWWAWTPTRSGRVFISTDGSSLDTLLAVYTGTAVNALTPVSRYAHLNVPARSAEEPFHLASRVELDAVAGTTYHIAVDGTAGAFGEVSLTIDSTFSFLDPVAELLPAGSEWEYLLLVNRTNQPVDPETLDPDFDSTWHSAAAYNGPAFSGPAPAMLGYGLIDVEPVVTDIWGGRDHDADMLPDAEPPTGTRFATYFRTTFTPTAAVEHLGFEGLVDDGAIIYINGVEATRLNVAETKDAGNWRTFADTANLAAGFGTEEGPQVGFALDINLPAGQPVELAVSLHNTSATSSDMGFDLRVYSVNLPPDPPAPPQFPVSIVPAATAGRYEISWTAVPGATYDLQWSPTADNDWLTILSDIPADASGTNTELDQPGTPASFYRVVQQ